jgi:hypothetical protein
MMAVAWVPGVHGYLVPDWKQLGMMEGLIPPRRAARQQATSHGVGRRALLEVVHVERVTKG